MRPPGTFKMDNYTNEIRTSLVLLIKFVLNTANNIYIAIYIHIYTMNRITHEYEGVNYFGLIFCQNS
jgi:hypothetical protein